MPRKVTGRPLGVSNKMNTTMKKCCILSRSIQGREISDLEFQITDAVPIAVDEALLSGHCECLDSLIRKGFYVVNAKSHRTTRPLLLLAAERGHESMVNFLLSKGVEIDGKDDTGNTALMLAANSNRIRVVEILLDVGADINATCKKGNCALSMVVWKGHLQVWFNLRFILVRARCMPLTSFL